MAIEVFERTEKKYLLNQQTYEKVLQEIEQHMISDEFSANGTLYNIANIYYDTPTDELIRKSLEKPVYKEKLRLRSYGVPDLQDMVFLEMKKKYKGVVYKRRTRLKLEEAYDLVQQGKEPQDSEYVNRQVLSEIQYFMQMYDLLPKVYISYDRRAYFGDREPELRVTFDTNIRTRRTELGLEKGNHGMPLLKEGFWLMEVKTSTAVPLWFTKILTENEIYGISFSKYGTEYTQRVMKKREEKGEEILCLNPFLMKQPAQIYQCRTPYLVS